MKYLKYLVLALVLVGCAVSTNPVPNIGPLKVNASNYTPIPNSNGTVFLNNLNNALSGATGIEPQFDSYTFALLPTATHNKIVFCQDCSTTSLTCTGGGTGTLAFYNGVSWFCLSTTASTSAGGTNGQIQYNNSGAFGGFTASGDATINTSTGAVAVTKTGGVAFAPSATTDTTNAANISSGTLGTARGGSGVSSPTAHDIMIAEGASAFALLNLGVDTVLQGTGVSSDPQPLTFPNCLDSGGNHLNYSTSTHLLSCGTSGGSTTAPIYPLPATYVGPTIRASANNTQAPVLMHPSSGAGTATMTFNAASQGNCQVGDLMVFFLEKDTGTITNASGTQLNNVSFSNGATEIWTQTQAAATSVVFSNAGNHIWNGLGVCVAPGTRGTPVLVDQHTLAASNTPTANQCIENVAQQLTGTHLNELHLAWSVQTSAANAAQNNSIFLANPLSDAANTNVGEGWTYFTIIGNDTNNGAGESVWGSYRNDDAKEPLENFPYIGANPGAGNCQLANIILY